MCGRQVLQSTMTAAFHLALIPGPKGEKQVLTSVHAFNMPLQNRRRERAPIDQNSSLSNYISWRARITQRTIRSGAGENFQKAFLAMINTSCCQEFPGTGITLAGASHVAHEEWGGTRSIDQAFPLTPTDVSDGT